MGRGPFVTSFSGALVLLLLAAAAGPARAADPVPWTVDAASGTVQQQSAAAGWVALAARTVLAPGAEVRTGGDGKLSLSHGKDRVTVSPGSEFSLPRGVDPATGPSLIERLGTLLFRIEHRPDRHFEVDGPYLAAVVKGTVFTVNAGALEDQVHVAEGAVQVTAPLAHRSALVRPGQTAVVTSSGKHLSVLGTPTPGKALRQRSDADDPSKSATASADAGPSAPDQGPRITRTLGDAPLDTAALSGGLVGGAGGPHGLAGGFKTSSADVDASGNAVHGSAAHGSGNAFAGAGNAGAGNAFGAAGNAGVGNAFAGAGNAGIGNAFAGAGNAGVGNAFAGAGNAGGGNAIAGAGNAGGGNAIAALGIPNAGGASSNAGGANAHGGNSNAGGRRH